MIAGTVLEWPATTATEPPGSSLSAATNDLICPRIDHLDLELSLLGQRLQSKLSSHVLSGEEMTDARVAKGAFEDLCSESPCLAEPRVTRIIGILLGMADEEDLDGLGELSPATGLLRLERKRTKQGRDQAGQQDSRQHGKQARPRSRSDREPGMKLLHQGIPRDRRSRSGCVLSGGACSILRSQRARRVYATDPPGRQVPVEPF